MVINLLTTMESHPLNLAHQQHRRAEAFLKNSKYDEAMQCHHNAAELLLDAMKSTTCSVALESISLQHSYHLKQKDLIKNKKEQYARVKKAMENIKRVSKDPTHNIQGNDNSKLEIAIYKAIQETDSLLMMLTTQNEQDFPSSFTTNSREGCNIKEIDKTNQRTVEELQILSQNLHSMVEKLVLQVEILKDENSTLKERVNYLEKERIKYLNLQINPSDFQQRQNSSVSKPPDVFTIDSLHQRSPVMGPSQPLFDLSALKDNVK